VTLSEKPETARQAGDRAEALLASALRIRLVEEEIIRLYPTDLIQSPVHLSIGQEAVAVGVCAALNEKDLIFPNYRGHSYFLARGGDLGQFFAELMGRQTGLSKGKAGSMHLADPLHNIMGASAVVASTISHAAGSALAERMKIGGSPDRLFVPIIGDGATEQGVFFETLNFAALHKLPVLFVIEDNSLAVHTSVSDRQAFSLPEVSDSFGIVFFEEESGFDPSLVASTALRAIKSIQTGGGPSLLRIGTMRYKEHVGPGEDFDSGYRQSSDLQAWKASDPLENLERFPEDVVTTIQNEIAEALDFALSSPVSQADELLTDVL